MEMHVLPENSVRLQMTCSQLAQNMLVRLVPRGGTSMHQALPVCATASAVKKDSIAKMGPCIFAKQDAMPTYASKRSIANCAVQENTAIPLGASRIAYLVFQVKRQEH